MCTFVDTIKGAEKEEGQDRLSLQTDFYFSPPSALLDGTAASITVEISALLAEEGSGGEWIVGINNGGVNDTYPIGDLAPVGTNWTTAAITAPLTPDEATGSFSNYLDANGEILTTLTSEIVNATQTKVVFVDYMVITASGGGSFAATSPTPTSTGVCTFVKKIKGLEIEELQDRLSLHAREGVMIGFENMANYVRLLSVFGNAQYDFYFTPPSPVTDGTAKSITVEASAIIATPGSGGVWTLGIGNGVNATGVFSPVETNWTTVSTTFNVDGDVTDHVDANGEMLIAVSCSEPDTTQVLFIDFMEISASEMMITSTTGTYDDDADAGESAEILETDADAVAQDTDSAPSVIFGGAFHTTVAAMVAASCAKMVCAL